MPRISTTTEWYEKAQLDYFTLFIKLWLCFNGWYRQQFQNETDREVVNNLKRGDNRLFDHFEREWFSSTSNDWKYIKASIEGLINTTSLFPVPDKNGNEWNFDDLDLSINDEKREGLFSTSKELVNNLNSNENSLEKLKNEELIIELSNSYFENEPGEIFARSMEIIYQVRCSLMHGDLNINDDNRHSLVKHCYNFLNTLMKNLI